MLPWRALLFDGAREGREAFSPLIEAIDVEYVPVDRAAGVDLSRFDHAIFAVDQPIALLSAAYRTIPGTIGIFVPRSPEILRAILDALDPALTEERLALALPFVMDPLGGHPLAGTYDTTLFPPRRAGPTGSFRGSPFAARSGRLVIGALEILSFAGPSESFHIMPMDEALAKDLVSAVREDMARWVAR